MLKRSLYLSLYTNTGIAIAHYKRAIAQDMQVMLRRCLRQPLWGTHHPFAYTDIVRAIAEHRR
ncbi:MAG: hypothetical protein RMY34_16390 [Aulosira sp. DedQUE10]|nr:hypothetical protein [Aulosira sp. DedQUE10]